MSFGQLVTAPLFRLGLGTGIEAAIGAGSQSKGQDHGDRKHQLTPDAPHLLVTKNGKMKFWQPIGALWAHSDGKGFDQRLDYLQLNDAEIVIRAEGAPI